MSGEEAKTHLIDLQTRKDKGTAHAVADDILCLLLTAIGYDDVVAEYKKLDRNFDR